MKELNLYAAKWNSPDVMKYWVKTFVRLYWMPVNKTYFVWFWFECYYQGSSFLKVHQTSRSRSLDQKLLYSVKGIVTRNTTHEIWKPCYVAVCNNYAICNTLQTALNCNAVCNTSYFKLRCEGNAICNVLQIASKFYHLKILKRRKKIHQLQNAPLQ